MTHHAGTAGYLRGSSLRQVGQFGLTLLHLSRQP